MEVITHIKLFAVELVENKFFDFRGSMELDIV